MRRAEGKGGRGGVCGSIVSGKMLEVVNAEIQGWHLKVSSLLFSLRGQNKRGKKCVWKCP